MLSFHQSLIFVPALSSIQLYLPNAPFALTVLHTAGASEFDMAETFDDSAEEVGHCAEIDVCVVAKPVD